MSTLVKSTPGTALEHATSFLSLNPERRRREIMKLVSAKEPAKLEPRSENDKRRVKTPPPMFAPFRDYILAKSKKGTSTSAHTLEAYQRSLEVLIDFANTAGFDLLRPEGKFGDGFGDVYRAHLANHYAPATQKQHRAAVSMFYKMLRWAGASNCVPFEDVQGVDDPVAPEDKNHHFTDDEIAALLEYSSDVDRVMVLLGCHAGLRVFEMCALTWGDVEGLTVVVQSGKGGKPRDVPMSKTLRAALDTLARADERVLPFTTTRARARLRALCARAGVEYNYKGVGGMHRLRHAAGFRFYLQTKSLTHTAKLLGHLSIETTKIYAAKADTLIADTVGSW